MARRRDDRIQAALPVRVWGMTLDSKPFNEHLKTCDVSRFGARIAFPNCPLKLGDIVGVQYKDEKARFRIVWIAPNKREFGVSSAEPGKSIWGTMPAGPMYPPRIGATPTPAAAAPAPAPAASAKERRRHKRFPCKGGAQIRRGDNPPIWATLADISAGGCYVETASALIMGTEYEVTIKVESTEIHCRCQARTCHPGIGAGLQFTFVTPEARKQINQLLDVLAGVAIGEEAAAADKHDISGRVYKSAEEVRAIETLLQSDTADVDPRILAEFRNAVDHARQTAWAVQTWVEMRKQRRDPFSLMPIVEKRRMRQATFLLKELLMDYQSGALSNETEGFSDLQKAIEDFHRSAEKQ